MNQVYRYLGYSKQAFHQKMNRKLKQREEQLLQLPIIEQLREDHPGAAAKQLYSILKPEDIGRDKFERLCFDHGFKLERPRAFKRTTDSTGVIRFPNLIAGIEFTSINQAWSSDITYYQIGENFYYLTFVLDLYSRTIVGFNVSQRLSTDQTTIPALKMALSVRNPDPGLIFHSDAGGQYYCKTFLKLTAEYKIKNSMCEVVYENAHAERINGTIKNQYLKGYNPENFESLVKKTAKAVYNYNCVRPHKSLNNIPPAAFEQLLPAGGSSLTNNHFCSSGNKFDQQQKNNYLPMGLKPILKPVEKTVNVF